MKAGFHWIQETIRLPLARGSRVLIGSSRAAISGSPMSGGYAGAKRMLWLMASYANVVSAELNLGIRFQALAFGGALVVGIRPDSADAASANATLWDKAAGAGIAATAIRRPPRSRPTRPI